MPKKQDLKCYFGCVIDGPLHHFPKPQWPNMERFNNWKTVLREETQAMGDTYLFNQVRLCYRHFEPYYRLPSKLLTRNAIPTLNLGLSLPTIENVEVKAPVIIPTIREVPVTAGTSHETVPAVILPDYKQSLAVKTCHKKLSFSKTHRKKELMQLTMRLQKLRNKCKTQTKQIRKAEKIAQTKSILKQMETFTKSAQTFIKMQMKTKTKARGRRYTLKEKNLSLTILKQSPKGYNFLKSIFALPSKRTLQKVLKLLILNPGINQELFDNIQSAVTKYPEEKKIVSLIFDEISLAPGLHYNKSQREIVGFEDFGSGRTQNFADHALVFMVKGLKSKFKQPVCFTFCKSATKTLELKNLIKLVVKHLHNAGLKVVATICDQSTTNVAAINNLKNETRALYLKKGEELKSEHINVEGVVIYPLYDTPHLLKGIRNNLLTKNLRYIMNNEVKMAKWEHLEMLLKEDVGEDEIRLVNKLTESHVHREKIPKMKVKHAAQVFSQRVSSAMRFLARRGILPKECEDTAEILLLFDKLFDSFNGHSYTGGNKIYKMCLKNGSPHFKLWEEIVPILRSMGFEKKKKQEDGTFTTKYEKVPSLTHFLHNIRTMKELWAYLNNECEITSLLTRNLNQDPLENFFCQIRSNGVRNINPTAYQFSNAFKTLLINNFTSPHSVNANCEEDKNKCFHSIKTLFDKKNKGVNEINEDIFDLHFDLINYYVEESQFDNVLHAEAKSYVTGYVAKKSKANIFKKCKVCTQTMFAQTDIERNEFIKERDYTKHSLNYPSNEFKKNMNHVYNVIVTCLRKIPQEHNLPAKISLYIYTICDFGFILCQEHKKDLIKYIIDLSLNIIIHSWCKAVNDILYGKISRFDETDSIKKSALVYHNTHKKNK